MKKGLIISIGLSAVILSACTHSLPSCGSSEAEKLVEQIINERSYVAGSFVELKEIEEIAFNKDSEIRVCSGRLITSKLDEEISYSIKWKNKQENMFYLEITN